MTIERAIRRADELKPNVFSAQIKTEWLAALDGRIAADVFLMSFADLGQLQYQYPVDANTELLVAFPHDDIYVLWLAAKIDEANGEYDKYQNSMITYNEHYGNFVRWFASTYEPAQGYLREE